MKRTKCSASINVAVPTKVTEAVDKRQNPECCTFRTLYVHPSPVLFATQPTVVTPANPTLQAPITLASRLTCFFSSFVIFHLSTTIHELNRAMYREFSTRLTELERA